MASSDTLPHGPLSGVKVLDLSRILAGPTCTQMLGDLGATVLKIENPRSGGDDTRQWGPPYVVDAKGNQSDLSAYFMSANRNKRSVEVDITTSDGQATIRRLAAHADILLENFKPGGLRKYGLDYDSLRKDFPHLVYGSISGYGQTGPNAHKPGYDLMAQGYGGIMSLTGEPDGRPMKVGVGIADVMCGMYACVGILAALRHKEQTGEGQQVDIALVDAQIAWLINEGVATLNTGSAPKRRGNEHPSIVPYGLYETADGHVILAVGNDSQFGRFLQFLGLEGLARDPRFATNPARLEHRDALADIIVPAIRQHTTDAVIAAMEERKVPAGPVQTLDQVFASDQVAARKMAIEMQSEAGPVQLLGNPLKLSRTPVTYRHAPPTCGSSTDVLEQDGDPFDAL
ncbi:CaiB/BaiF CoA transferase family protein [Phaeobacter italicus]|uniref:CaiB/BaiF CoA transferase family protein n=1 Tax=Phaeobacter italicus TaxID=481446 RepID=UPI0002F43D5B|nr:CaiB/BaiF CoA-transferase family protein [Phaeobacter italicus]GLO74758.1 CoA transferase [Phaeobacter italicus]CRL13977.1 Formyl-coenzyme A transferase [Phaeobacter italicus]SFG12032.1 Crotonobetainyl-CoA:carnitine CoA-transferase CaiB [Phaeobacter italicus]